MHGGRGLADAEVGPAHASEPDSDRWLILIAYVIGLSIGVHLLNLLTLPALGFIYYYRRTAHPTLKGGMHCALVVSMVIVGSILVGIIPGLPTLAGGFEVFFINTARAAVQLGPVHLPALCLSG